MTAKLPDTFMGPAPAGLAGVPLDTADLARRSVDQAEAACERAGELAHSSVQLFDAAASALKASATEVQLKAIEIAQANANMLFALARHLLAVRDPADIVHIQRQFVTEQMQAFVRHTGEVQALAAKLVSDAARAGSPILQLADHSPILQTAFERPSLRSAKPMCSCSSVG